MRNVWSSRDYPTHTPAGISRMRQLTQSTFTSFVSPETSPRDPFRPLSHAANGHREFFNAHFFLGISRRVEKEM